MNNKLYVIAKYHKYFKPIELPFRPMKDDKIIDEKISMTINEIIINKNIQDGIIICVSIANAVYHDQEALYEIMISKGWKKDTNNLY